MKKKILISTGGSGGHVNPAVGIHEHLKDKYDVILSTDLRGKKFLDKELDSYLVINTPKLNNKFFFPINIITVIFLTIRSFFLLRKEKIEFLFSTGGYMSLPLCLASIFLKIDIYLLEPNMVLGRANKFFLNSCKKIFCYSRNIKNFPKNNENKKVVINPIVRKRFFENNDIDIKKDKFAIIVVGGSQGANIFDKFFNEAFININKLYPLKIFHQTHKNNVNILNKFYSENQIENKVFSYDKDLSKMIKDSDLCVTRAGASTLSELVVTNVPFLAIPLPTSKDNHQFENASFYKDNGYCWIINQNELNQKKIEDFFFKILKNPDEYDNKKINIKNFRINNSWINDNKKILELIG